jgi:hypothetical protein
MQLTAPLAWCSLGGEGTSRSMRMSIPLARPRAVGGKSGRRARPLLPLSLLAWSALCVGAPAGGAAPLLPQVTVQAPRPPTPAELAGESVPHFVLHHATAPTALGQLTRWREGICPMTRGLDPGFDAFVTARIRAVAASVGAPVEPGTNCKVNVEILFTTEPQAAIDDIAKASPMLLGNHERSQLTSMESVRHPIQGWYVTATRGESGARVVDDDTRISVIWGGTIAGSVPACQPGSRLHNECNSEIVNVILIADTNRVAGYTIGSISDYLAVLALTMVQSPENCDPLPSILDLMTPGCHDGDKSGAVTAGDLAFLEGLYRTDLSAAPMLERENIFAQMMRGFGKR